LLNIKLSNNSETRSHILAIFGDKTDFEKFLATKLSGFNDLQFTKYIPKRISSPIIDRQLILSKIPLFLDKNDIHMYFKSVGDIEKINLSPYEGYLSGNITFTSPDAINDFVTFCGWSILKVMLVSHGQLIFFLLKNVYAMN